MAGREPLLAASLDENYLTGMESQQMGRSRRTTSVAE